MYYDLALFLVVNYAKYSLPPANNARRLYMNERTPRSNFIICNHSINPFFLSWRGLDSERGNQAFALSAFSFRRDILNVMS